MEFVTGPVGHAGERMVNPRLEPGVALGDALCDFLRFSVFAAFQLSQFLFLIPQGKASLAGGPGLFPILALLDGRHIRKSQVRADQSRSMILLMSLKRELERFTSAIARACFFNLLARWYTKHHFNG
jgi:hypothetical protein